MVISVVLVMSYFDADFLPFKTGRFHPEIIITSQGSLKAGMFRPKNNIRLQSLHWILTIHNYPVIHCDHWKPGMFHTAITSQPQRHFVAAWKEPGLAHGGDGQRSSSVRVQVVTGLGSSSRGGEAWWMENSWEIPMGGFLEKKPSRSMGGTLRWDLRGWPFYITSKSSLQKLQPHV